MKKKAIAISLALVVAMGTLAACGSNAPADTTGDAAVESTTTDETAEAPAADDTATVENENAVDAHDKPYRDIYAEVR